LQPFSVWTIAVTVATSAPRQIHMLAPSISIFVAFVLRSLQTPGIESFMVGP
jgi:hypothetical protein